MYRCGHGSSCRSCRWAYHLGCTRSGRRTAAVVSPASVVIQGPFSCSWRHEPSPDHQLASGPSGSDRARSPEAATRGTNPWAAGWPTVSPRAWLQNPFQPRSAAERREIGAGVVGPIRRGLGHLVIEGEFLQHRSTPNVGQIQRGPGAEVEQVEDVQLHRDPFEQCRCWDPHVHTSLHQASFSAPSKAFSAPSKATPRPLPPSARLGGQRHPHLPPVVRVRLPELRRKAVPGHPSGDRQPRCCTGQSNAPRNGGASNTLTMAAPTVRAARRPEVRPPCRLSLRRLDRTAWEPTHLVRGRGCQRSAWTDSGVVPHRRPRAGHRHFGAACKCRMHGSAEVVGFDALVAVQHDGVQILDAGAAAVHRADYSSGIRISG
jgi:hypothetical protein